MYALPDASGSGMRPRANVELHRGDEEFWNGQLGIPAIT